MEAVITFKKNLKIGLDWENGVRLDLPFVAVSVFGKDWRVYVTPSKPKEKQVIAKRTMGFRC